MSTETPAKARLKARYASEIVPALREEFHHSNVNEVPRLTKIVVNMGVGEAARDSKLIDGAIRDLAAITGQKPQVTKSRKSIAQFKLRDRLAGLGDLRLLTGDGGEVADRSVDELGVASRLADTHVHHDLGQARDLVDVRVVELLAQRRDDLTRVAGLEPRLGWGLSTHQTSLPERFATRTRVFRLWPSRSIVSMRKPTRVPFLDSGSTSITLLTWIGASTVSIPPVRTPRVV